MQRRCDIFKATDDQWYVLLGNFEYAEETEECTCYGPFVSQAAAEGELEYHSNPGGYSTNPHGKRPVLTSEDCTCKPPTTRRLYRY